MIAAVWIVAGLGLLCWSLLLWATHALLNLPTGWSQPASDWLGQQPWAAWLETWWPGWQTLVSIALDLVQALTQGLAQVSPWLTVLLWTIWAVGALLLLGLAGLLHGLVRVVTRPSPALPPTHPAA